MLSLTALSYSFYSSPTPLLTGTNLLATGLPRAFVYTYTTYTRDYSCFKMALAVAAGSGAAVRTSSAQRTTSRGSSRTTAIRTSSHQGLQVRSLSHHPAIESIHPCGPVEAEATSLAALCLSATLHDRLLVNPRSTMAEPFFLCLRLQAEVPQEMPHQEPEGHRQACGSCHRGRPQLQGAPLPLSNARLCSR